jgi:hypothetical protein
MQPLYLHNIAVYVKFLSVHIGQDLPRVIDR